MLLLYTTARSQTRQYDEAAFYIGAHQDDWQLFMGADAYNDIHDFDEKKSTVNGKKVVFIYVTAGNLHDDDDRKTCDCKEPHKRKYKKIAYWQVREIGAKNSTHLAACQLGSINAQIPYPENKEVTINGHKITRYEFKNTVSYFLRLKAGIYSKWKDSAAIVVGTMDDEASYSGRADLVKTLYDIYVIETAMSVPSGKAVFHMPDTDSVINPYDHTDHRIAAGIALEATNMLAERTKACYNIALHVDYHTENLPENITGKDAQNEAALVGAYCLALLDYNAWPEWGDIYQKWTTRNYSRTVSTCDK